MRTNRWSFFAVVALLIIFIAMILIYVYPYQKACLTKYVSNESKNQIKSKNTRQNHLKAMRQEEKYSKSQQFLNNKPDQIQCTSDDFVEVIAEDTKDKWIFGLTSSGETALLFKGDSYCRKVNGGQTSSILTTDTNELMLLDICGEFKFIRGGPVMFDGTPCFFSIGLISDGQVIWTKHISVKIDKPSHIQIDFAEPFVTKSPTPELLEFLEQRASDIGFLANLGYIEEEEHQQAWAILDRLYNRRMGESDERP